jgi:predicted nucleic acid-binding protein
MTFADLVTGDSVFVDANTLIHLFQPHPQLGPFCQQLIQRIDNQDLVGFTSSHVVSEVCHRLMTVEANFALGWSITGIGNRLRTNPHEVQRLSLFRRAVEQIAQSRLQILSVTPPMLIAAVALCQQLGLLTNDAVSVALMQANGLTKIASSDTDFDRVPGLTRYAPQ